MSKNKPKYSLDYLIIFGLFSIVYIIVYTIAYFREDYSASSFQFILSASAQTLATLLAVIFTITLVLIQINLPRYSFWTIDQIKSSKELKRAMFIYFITISLNLVAIAWISTDKIIIRWTPVHSISGLALYFTIVSLLFYLPLMILGIYKIFTPEKALDKLEKELIDQLKTGNVPEVERFLNYFQQVLSNSISSRDIPLTIISLRKFKELLRYYIDNHEEMFNKLEIGNHESGYEGHDYSDWFFDELISTLTSNYIQCIKSNFKNPARTIVKTLDEIGSMSSSLSKKELRLAKLTSEAYEGQRNNKSKQSELRLAKLTSEALANCAISALDDDYFFDDVVRISRFFLVEDSFQKDKEHFVFIVSPFYEYSFLHQVLKTSPARMESINSQFLWHVRYLENFEGKKENIPLLVSMISNSISVAERMRESRWVADNPYIEEQLLYFVNVGISKLFVVGTYCIQKSWNDIAISIRISIEKIMPLQMIREELIELVDKKKDRNLNEFIQHFFSYQDEHEKRIYKREDFDNTAKTFME